MIQFKKRKHIFFYCDVTIFQNKTFFGWDYQKQTISINKSSKNQFKYKIEVPFKLKTFQINKIVYNNDGVKIIEIG